MPHHADQKPSIVVGKSDELRLTALATAAVNGARERFARALLAELERADVVRDGELPPDAVRMHAEVEFDIDGRERRSVRLVYPGEADIDQGSISILTPIGTALLGLTPGQSITHAGPDGRPHRLTVVAVKQPQSAI